jgi:hypothetical protein
MTPTAYGRFARRVQKERMERMRSFRGDACTLSETTFLTLKPMTLLAVRIAPWRTGFAVRAASHFAQDRRYRSSANGALLGDPTENLTEVYFPVQRNT